MSTVTRSLFVLSALSFFEIGNRGEFCYYDSPCVKALVESLHCSVALFLSLIFDVDIADHMVSNVIRNHDLIDFSELG